jgi:hypothetical protein
LSRTSTTLAPMKPFEPVTRMFSSKWLIESLSFCTNRKMPKFPPSLLLQIMIESKTVVTSASGCHKPADQEAPKAADPSDQSSRHLVIALRLHGIVDGQHDLCVVEAIFRRQPARLRSLRTSPTPRVRGRNRPFF